MKKYKQIPVSAAREIAKKYDKSIVIINAWDPEHGLLHTTTWGRNKEECGWAAEGGKISAKALGADLEQAVHYQKLTDKHTHEEGKV